MIKLTIDGKNIEVQEGTTVLKAAEATGIYIPTLCSHPQLTPYGGCRLCMVEVEGAPTLQPSCTLPAVNGMVVKTNTEKVMKARKFVLTLIFSERNHFCMYCPVSDGDCELQNRAYDEDMTHWDLQPNWQPFNVDASHPYIILDNNRCILCRRCVRACDELVGNYTLGFEERGADSLLVADYNVPLGESSCISCGTCVQICPTGALIDRQSAYQGKETEVEHHIGVCVECPVGCQRDVLTRDNRLVRIEGDWDAPLNHGLLCEKGRFLPLEDDRDRILTPLIRKDGSLKATTWEEALKVAAESFNNEKGLAAITSTRLPAEDMALFKSIFGDNLKADLVTTLEEGKPTSSLAKMAEKLGKSFETSLESLKDTDAVLSLELDLVDDYQVAGFFIKRQLMNGTKLIVADSKDNKLAEATTMRFPLTSGEEADFLTQLLDAFENSSENPALIEIVNVLKESEKACIVYGEAFAANADETAITLLLNLAEKINARLIGVKGNANSMTAAQLELEAPINVEECQAAFILLGDEDPSQKLVKTLEEVPFVVAQTTYRSQLTGKADVVLPVAMWAEQSGTYLSLDGKMQKAIKSLDAPEGVLTSREVLQKIAKSLSIEPNMDWKASLMKRMPTVQIQEA
ncbi:MAG: 2Fe-2S iron-sulfur cluster-binding protein [Chloroflexota bacterium]|nr:2Fe-2S iron-sulfur cluster-binding protein [Chloroflexota bacterium]